MLTLLILLAIATAFAIAGLAGAPYVPILRRDTQAVLALADLKPGQTLIDLGSGDGQLLRAAATRGIRCIGYEINPIMVVISRLVCWRYRRLVTIRLANLWHTPLPPAAAIYAFLMPRYMNQLHHKLVTEVTHPTRVISYIFPIPDATPHQHTANAYLYTYPATSQLESTP